MGCSSRFPPELTKNTSTSTSDDSYEFPYDIRRVAVIGAGPAGLTAAVTLVEYGFDVRLFERTTNPGGNWNWSPERPVRETFPNRPLETLAYEPDIPPIMPSWRVYEDGEDGISSDWRLRDQWSPSPVWNHLRANSHPSITGMPGVNYPPNTPWDIPKDLIQSNTRAYASAHDLNSSPLTSQPINNITSYSTRVERLLKTPGSSKWTLTLRKLEKLPYSTKPNAVRAEWWTEDFDAVVVASGPFDGPWVPNLPGIKQAAERWPDGVYHSRRYRNPSDYSGKNVLIVGGSVSASEIARDLAPHVANFSISIRPNMKSIFRRRSFLRLPANITKVPLIGSFELPPEDTKRTSWAMRDVVLQFVDGTNATGFDEIILCTGYRRSMPFLVDFRNSSIVNSTVPQRQVEPIITDGMRLHSLHWTGHYIPDPTLAFANGPRSWTLGRYQALGLARTWSRTARLPSTKRMWETYPGTKGDLWEQGPFGTLGEEAFTRLWVMWLNNAAIEFGGPLVEPLPFNQKEEFIYFANLLWEEHYINHQTWIDLENKPRKEWPRRKEP
ncbi:FAD/NAD(P)-binding domain-containing protein [Clavulina sp. PMI_390]|nr:FAD/NAD(P)-binding domain-containing protein [Clavulina sp. PMI_390]